MKNRFVIPAKVKMVYEQNEYLAHYVAYNAHDPSKSFTLPTGYRLLGPHTPLDGLVYYILECPTSQAERDIHVIFRGTKDLPSIARDFEPKAPGSSSIILAAPDIHKELHRSLKKLIEQSELPISITITGHSLGASDGQNYFADLIKLIDDWTDDDIVEDKNFYFQKITRVRLVAFNSPGVTQPLANKVAYFTSKLFQKNPNFQIECYWLLVAGDIVQQFGETNVLADYLKNLIEIHLVKVTLKNPNIFKFENHRAHVFNETAYEKHNYEYYSNVDNAFIVSQKLNNKSYFFNLNAIEFCKFFLYNTTYYLHLFKNGKRPTESKTSIAHEPYVDVQAILEREKLMRRTRRNSVQVHPVFADEDLNASIFNKVVEDYLAYKHQGKIEISAEANNEAKPLSPTSYIESAWNKSRFLLSYLNFFANRTKTTAAICEISNNNNTENTKPTNN